MLTAADMLLFQVYDSFNRLEAQHLALGFGFHRLSYQIIRGNKFPCIVGKVPYRFHRLSWLVAFLFPKIPDAVLPLRDVLALEEKLTKFVEKRVPTKLNLFERRIIAGAVIALVLGFLGVIL
jgi:hypothetical protein